MNEAGTGVQDSDHIYISRIYCTSISIRWQIFFFAGVLRWSVLLFKVKTRFPCLRDACPRIRSQEGEIEWAYPSIPDNGSAFPCKLDGQS